MKKQNEKKVVLGKTASKLSNTYLSVLVKVRQQKNK